MSDVSVSDVDTTAPDAAVQTSSAPPSDQDLGNLLNEFDSGTVRAGSDQPSSNTETAAEPATPQQPRQPTESDLHKLAMQAGADRALIEELLINQHFAAMRQQETADYQSLLKEAGKYLEGAAVTDDYADRYLRAEYELNPEVKQAWDQRYDSAEAKVQCDRILKRTLTNMAKAVARIPDREATADREMVTAAVRGANQPRPPTDADYSRKVANMSDAEFERERERLGM